VSTCFVGAKALLTKNNEATRPFFFLQAGTGDKTGPTGRACAFAWEGGPLLELLPRGAGRMLHAVALESD
jgi:hypothetical protein